ncbi:UPF0462 protein C4orf33-like isoform X1 [Sceloporus undulatus]|uniref:UPF0462 protein C4orf33-like isoform X1 n=1 Tax=Sceloporus undulatus TaxID=8520 RepID=UPI001C4CEBDF|nr:UPF0462 protein C4orf33-like isoform X1 [Sceloporus undulatus]
MEFKIEHTWNSLPLSHDPIVIKLTPENSGILMEVSAPFFNDPPAPPGEAGKPFNGLWDYEVLCIKQGLCTLNQQKQRFTISATYVDKFGFWSILDFQIRASQLDCVTFTGRPQICIQQKVVEAFFLNGQTQQYLEVELCPHGQHLVLLLSGRRKVCKQELPLTFEVSRTSTNWIGKAHLPWSYFPPATDKFNAFAIHGSGVDRTYEALFPIPQLEIQKEQKPDFHRLEYFKRFNLKLLMGDAWKQPDSDLWALCKHNN